MSQGSKHSSSPSSLSPVETSQLMTPVPCDKSDVRCPLGPSGTPVLLISLWVLYTPHLWMIAYLLFQSRWWNTEGKTILQDVMSYIYNHQERLNVFTNSLWKEIGLVSLNLVPESCTTLPEARSWFCCMNIVSVTKRVQGSRCIGNSQRNRLWILQDIPRI